ncbi:MAG: leucine-rich repeat domain-containing protein [Prevotella sp.]|nr:leucine-rich repeat domain-containing protein [Prevotella sp.]
MKGLCAMALLSLCAAQADADDTTFSATNTWTDGDGETQTCTLYYNITSDNTVMVTQNPSGTYSGAIVIPETVTNDGTTYTVTGVEDKAFQLSSIKSVDLSNVSTIGRYSFSCCPELDSLTIGSKIKEIPACAFYGNGDSNKAPSGVNQIKYLTIPSQITSIGDSAFHSPSSLVKLEFADNSQCTHIGVRAFCTDDVVYTQEVQGAIYFTTLYKELDIPESVTFIGDSCFWGSSYLEKLTLHEGLDSIGAAAFSGYVDNNKYYSPIITEITIPSTVTYIGDLAFEYSRQLKTVTYNAAAVKNVYTTTNSPFYNDGKTITKLVIGPKVRELPDYLIYGATDDSGNLEVEWNAERCEYFGKYCLHVDPGTLTIGAGVKEIYTTTDSNDNELEEPVGLFYSNTGLELKTCLTTLNYNAKECPIAGTLDNIPFTMSTRSTVFPLATVNFGDSVKIIPAHLLNGGSFYIQKSGSNAGTYYNAFPSLTTINLPASVETVGDYAFNYCAYLTSITFNGTNLKTIGDHAFANCHNESLTSILLPASLDTIGNNAFDSCQYVAALEIPASVKCIGDSAFHYCIGAQSITFVDTEDQTSALTSIGDGAFEKCCNENLTTITLPNALETIGKLAFDSIPNVATLTIPANITSIGDSAFANWTTLATLTYNAVNCTKAGSASGPVFAGSNNFKKLTIGKDVEIIPTYLFNQCAALDTVVYNPTNCTSVTTDYEYPTFRGCSSIANAIIGDGITNVPDRLFDGYGTPSKVTQSENIESATDEETDYGDPDSYGFANFKNLTLPSSLTSIGDYAFRLCTGLDTLNIQEGITTVGNHAFESCTGLDTLTISSSLSSLGDSCFYNCTGLSTVYYNAADCSLAQADEESEEVVETAEEDVNNEGDNNEGDEDESANDADIKPAFKSSSLKKLVIGEGVENIPTYIFNQCAALDTVVYNPTNCTSVTTDYEYPTFRGCSSIANAIIGDGITNVPDRLFDGYGTPSKVTQSENIESATDEETDYGDPDSYGFANFKNLTLPSSLTSIGDYAFRLCTGLDTLNIQEGITTVGNHAFESCTGLDTLKISKDLNSLGDSCFYNCSSLSTVYENRPLAQLQTSDASTIDATDDDGGTTVSTGVPTAGTDCFANTPQACWLVVPEDAAEIYGSSHRATKATADGWATINHMREATITVSLTNKDGYITRYSPYAYNTADNLQGLIVTGVGEGSTTTRTEYTKDENGEITDSTTVTTITYALTTQAVNSDGKDIPAGTAVLLKGEENNVNKEYVNYTYNDNSAETATIDDDVDGTTSDTGYLHGTVDSNVTTYATVEGESSDVSDSYYFFTLSLNSNSDADSHGFYWMNANGTPFTASPDKAWLALSKSLFPTDDDENTEVLIKIGGFFDDEDEEDVDLDSTESIDGDETTTGISSLSSDTKDAVIYNMAGLRVNDMNRPGIYIVGGKKVVKK